MPTVKPWKGWAVFTPKGICLEWTLKPSRRESIERAEKNAQFRQWHELRDAGYRVARVEVREIVKQKGGAE